MVFGHMTWWFCLNEKMLHKKQKLWLCMSNIINWKQNSVKCQLLNAGRELFSLFLTMPWLRNIENHNEPAKFITLFSCKLNDFEGVKFNQNLQVGSLIHLLGDRYTNMLFLPFSLAYFSKNFRRGEHLMSAKLSMATKTMMENCACTFRDFGLPFRFHLPRKEANNSLCSVLLSVAILSWA